MKLQIFKRPQVLRDLEEAFVFLGENDADVAFRFLKAVETNLDLLSDHPYVGAVPRLENRKLDGIRIWPVTGFEKYLIFYFVRDEAIEVIRVLSTARDIRGILGSDQED